MVKPSISTLVAGLSLLANAVPAMAGHAREKGAFFVFDLPPGVTIESESDHCYARNPANCVKHDPHDPKWAAAKKESDAQADAQIAKVKKEWQDQTRQLIQDGVISPTTTLTWTPDSKRKTQNGQILGIQPVSAIQPLMPGK